MSVGVGGGGHSSALVSLHVKGTLLLPVCRKWPALSGTTLQSQEGLKM